MCLLKQDFTSRTLENRRLNILMADSFNFPPLRLPQLLPSLCQPYSLPRPRLGSVIAVQSASSLSIVPKPIYQETSSQSPNESSEDTDQASCFSENLADYEEDEYSRADRRRDKPYSFRRTVNCWLNFVRTNSKLKDNRKLKHNINQTFFRGLSDSIRHLEIGEIFDFSPKFIGAASKTRASKAAFEAFASGVQPYVAEVYRHFCKKLRYDQANISFCQKERMKALELKSALKAFLHYTAFVFFDLNAARLEKRFRVTYTGTDPLDEVWLRVKTYYAFNMLIEEVCLKEVEVLQIMREEGLDEHFSASYSLYKTYSLDRSK
jgi:hypothetical protein